MLNESYRFIDLKASNLPGIERDPCGLDNGVSSLDIPCWCSQLLEYDECPGNCFHVTRGCHSQLLYFVKPAYPKGTAAIG